ncbi:MAG TPA: cupin domain-containing protein [Candidatus Dormibacteraeota bacterium]|jgi:mannose-6-phosphate isomerase-like protein (cupin superfamily)
MVIVMGQEQLMRRLESEASDPYRWSNGPGHRYAAHVHHYEKVLYCEAGSISFHLEEEGRQVDLEAGDRMVLPAGTRHSAVVGPGGCVCIEGRR